VMLDWAWTPPATHIPKAILSVVFVNFLAKEYPFELLIFSLSTEVDSDGVFRHRAEWQRNAIS